jgi:hypothetical protein
MAALSLSTATAVTDLIIVSVELARMDGFCTRILSNIYLTCNYRQNLDVPFLGDWSALPGSSEFFVV